MSNNASIINKYLSENGMNALWNKTMQTINAELKKVNNNIFEAIDSDTTLIKTNNIASADNAGIIKVASTTNYPITSTITTADR